MCVLSVCTSLQVKPEDIRLETVKDEAGKDVPHVLGSGAHGKACLRLSAGYSPALCAGGPALRRIQSCIVCWRKHTCGERLLR